MTKLSVETQSWPIAGTFTISRGSKTEAEVVVAELQQGDFRGRGECVPYARYAETPDTVTEQIESARYELANGLDRQSLQSLLPPGAARNALDCAFWDIEAKRAGKRVWELAGFNSLSALTTAYTLSLDTPENMHRKAAENANLPLLKLKLCGPEDLERVAAVREGSPASRIVVDANEGWDEETIRTLLPELQALGVEMIEQPLPAGHDQLLSDLSTPICLCADESCHDSNTLPDITGKYGMINIKLDKTGGLTEALHLAAQARQAGLLIMTGCMVSTSLAMAPAMVVAQMADIVDLDGPLLLSRDRTHGIAISNGIMNSFSPQLWG